LEILSSALCGTRQRSSLSSASLDTQQRCHVSDPTPSNITPFLYSQHQRIFLRYLPLSLNFTAPILPLSGSRAPASPNGGARPSPPLFGSYHPDTPSLWISSSGQLVQRRGLARWPGEPPVAAVAGLEHLHRGVKDNS
jgi:hypothetical protein